MILTETQEKWLQALESGKYEQTVTCLRNDRGFCCLGVFCEIEGCQKSQDGGYVVNGVRYNSRLPDELTAKLGLKNDIGSITITVSLTSMNDNGMSFKDIATFCRKNPEKVFICKSGEKNQE
ncbi:MAG: hypothetical protein KGI50_05900 [Patescibacteria group bacterium]|nr:hypothetical protein [Patescibacteria group bacterium]MDE2438809.1 hypothetical protein [Patescibacteria group bacterium]